MARVIDKAKFFDRIGYTPHRGQMEYHTSPQRFKVPCCGRRYGKSTMAARDLEPELFIPDRMFWIVGPTYDLGEKEFRVIWDDLIIGQKLGLNKQVKKSYNKSQGLMFIEFPWRTRVEVRSADHPESLVGEGLDGVILSEAAKHRRDTWERFIRAALADKRGWATFPTTPEGHNWLYQLWRLGNNPEFPDYKSWRFPSWENSIVYPGGRQDPEILLLEKTTSPEWFEQEIGADFSSFVGKVYSEFDESRHVKQLRFNPNWPNYISFDWGFTNPLAAIEFQITPWDDVYIWREHYRAFTTLEEHLRILRSRPQPDGYHLDLAFGDSEDPEAVAVVSSKFVPCMALPEAKTNWRQGIEVVKRYLKEYETGATDDFGTPVTKPKLFVDHSCDNTIKEFNTYKMAQGSLSYRNPSSPREKPQKIDDHAMDAIRYGLMHIFELGAQHHLSEVYNTTDFSDLEVPDAGYFTTESLRF